MNLTISRSSALSINVSLIFDMHDLKGALFVKVSFLFLFSALLSPSTVIIPLTTIYASLQSHKH